MEIQRENGTIRLKEEDSVAPIGLVLTEGAKELGKRIDKYLLHWTSSDKKTFVVESECPRFSSGDSKGLIKETVRGKDLYFIVDIGNYSCTYNLFGKQNAMSPDDHYQDLKRLIQAASGKAHRLNVIMPLLYGGRQHRRNYRESLDCACMLQELENMGVANIICFDAHDSRVQNAIPLMGFDNVIPYYQVLKALTRNFPDICCDRDSLMIVSPDEGAMSRNIYYASVLEVDLGMFYKRRDYSVIESGRNPIIAHEYLGTSVEGKDIFITDDIISSGESMLDIAYALRKKNARRIFCYATYSIFTGGLEEFDKAYRDGILNGVFGTNLTYSPPELLARDWYYQVDTSKYISYFIAAMNNDISVSTIIDPHAKIKQLLHKEDDSCGNTGNLSVVKRA
ncbi:MAG: ribose-phosphate pyrophosphokinase [Oscillospiraceae bacterium]